MWSRCPGAHRILLTSSLWCTFLTVTPDCASRYLSSLTGHDSDCGRQIEGTSSRGGIPQCMEAMRICLPTARSDSQHHRCSSSPMRLRGGNDEAQPGRARRKKKKKSNPFKLDQKDGAPRRKLPLTLRGKKMASQAKIATEDELERDGSRRAVPKDLLHSPGGSRRWHERQLREKRKQKETKYVARRRRLKVLKEYEKQTGSNPVPLLGPMPEDGLHSVKIISGLPVQETFLPEQVYQPPPPPAEQVEQNEPTALSSASNVSTVGRDVPPRKGLRVDLRDGASEEAPRGERGTITRVWEEGHCQVLWDDGTLLNHTAAQDGSFHLVCHEPGPPPSKPQRSGAASPAVAAAPPKKGKKRRKTLEELYLEKKAEKEAAREAKRERRERMERERGEAKAARLKWRKKLGARTRRGQPVMQHQMERLMLQISKQQRLESQQHHAQPGQPSGIQPA